MTAAEFAKAVMAAALHEGDYIVEYAKPMGAFVVRFSGTKLAHAGKTLDAALDRIFTLAKRPVVFRGFLAKGAKRTRYGTPRKLDAAGRKLLTTSLATIKAMPMDASMIYFTDGKPDGLVPEDFAAYFSLAKDARNTFATGKGFLTVAVPLAALTDPKLLALVDELVVLLSAEVAFLAPALWLAPHNLFNSTLNDFDSERASVEVWGKFPQLEMPNQLASRSPFDFDEYEPSALAGLLAPAWVMWFRKHVERYGGTTAKLHGGATRYHATTASPFAMTDAIYAEYQARWAELAAVHVSHDATEGHARYYRDRFAAKSFRSLYTDWKSAFDVAEAQRKRGYEISAQLQELGRKANPKLLDYAASVAKELTADHGWYFLPTLQNLLEQGKARADEATVWLDHFEQLGDDRLLTKAAAVAAAAGEHDRGIDLLRRAIKAKQVDPKHLVRDADYKPLRKHAEWKKLVGAR